VATYGVAEAKNNFTHLLEQAEGGERIIITRHGKPIAELKAVVPERPLPSLEQRRAAMDRLREMRESLPSATQTSEELLDELYADKPW
jgi:prevent-host-death family protein